MGTLEISEKPISVIEYKKWLQVQHSVEISNITQTYYELTTTKAREDLSSSEFWKRFLGILKSSAEEYLLNQGGYNLFQTEDHPKMLIKPFDSLVEKSFRNNVLTNKDWPQPPPMGWILPENWFSRTNDILRTSLIAKYMDGVQFLVEKIKSLCTDINLECFVSYEAREEGYYAAHVNIRYPFEIADPSMVVATTKMNVEIQITTQLQELIRTLTHRYYEAKRCKFEEEEIKWQWNYRSDEFVPYYLGHILHYLEGMIMEVREGQRGARS
jgi:ppGpp synthetase/RelA/SpoT-type nucleotidyltranferase